MLQNNGNAEVMATDGPDFRYLLSMPMKVLTRDNCESVRTACRNKREELVDIERKSPQEMWLDDLQQLEDEVDLRRCE